MWQKKKTKQDKKKQNKTEAHKKKPVNSLLFLTRLSRDNWLSTESDNTHSLQSL